MFDLILTLLLVTLIIVLLGLYIHLLTKKPKPKDKYYAFRQLFKVLLIPFILVLFCNLTFAAIDFNGDLTQQEQQQFDQILAPVMKIYNFIKYAATIIGVLMLVFSGVNFLIAAGDQHKKEVAKNTAVGVIIGLVVIWVAPLVVQYIFS